MTTIASVSSSQTALAQAQAKLAADQAAKAADDIIKADQKAVDEASQQDTAQSVASAASASVQGKGVVDITA
ncbi:MAG: hypothetical protein K2X60_12390 [Xanthobacteraceae bacterium]|nr:hypothetical protein [Xanthobacteraceae bacterium]